MTTSIREARPEDAEEVAALLAELGYPMEAEEAGRRLAGATERVLVAADGGRLAGLVAVAIGSQIVAPRPLARVTALVVRPEARRTGTGRRLMDAAVGLAREAGCAGVELTSGIRPEREASHRFYEAYGFKRTSYRFSLHLE